MTVYEVSGRVQYGNVIGVSRLSITRSRGIQPATVQFVLPVNPGPISEPMPVYLYDGQNSIVLPDCMMQSIDSDYGNGEECLVTLLDFRWRWQFGSISGDYNYVRGGVIALRSKADIAKLAAKCLAKMGVLNSDLRALNAKSIYPTVSWDQANPAQALDSMLSEYGYVLCPQLNGSVKVAKEGEGFRLPRMAGSEYRNSIAAKSLPKTVEVTGAPTAWEIALKIETPVGIDREKQTAAKPTIEDVKPIDKLSYKPVEGWETEDPFLFPNVGKNVLPSGDAARGITNQDYVKHESEAARVRGMAEASIWRMFRFKVDLKLPLPNGAKEQVVKSIDEIEIQPDLLTEMLIAYEVDGKNEAETRRQAPYVYGRYFDQRFGIHNVEEVSHEFDSDSQMIYHGAFSVDAERGIISFSEPVFILEEKDGKHIYKSPELYLRCAVTVKHSEGGKVRERKIWDTGVSYKTEPMVVRSDRRLEVTTKLDKDKLTISKDTLESLQTTFGELIEAQKLQFRMLTPETATYPGFVPIELDGAVQQVTYTIETSGLSTTTASYGTEHSLVVPSYEERRAMERSTDLMLWTMGEKKDKVIK